MASSPTPRYVPRPELSFPPAAQPHLVRAVQKDAHYLAQLQAAAHDVARSVLGVRALHRHAALVAAVAQCAYFLTATAGGAQTLGEEYVNAVMVGPSGRVVHRRRRVLFISLHIVLPMLSAQLYRSVSHALQRAQAARAQTHQRAVLRANAVRAAPPRKSRGDRIVDWWASALPVEGLERIKSWLRWGASAHLAVFYMSGKYYSVAQRAARVRYISTIPARPGQSPPSYEVLGFLLAFQLVVKSMLGLIRVHRSATSESASEKRAQPKETVRIDDSIWSHASTPAVRLESGMGDDVAADEPGGAHVPLVYPDPDALPSREALQLPASASRATLEAARAVARGKAAQLENAGESIRRCTLCMETRRPERGASAVTQCGHVFDWGCITNWVKEKPECPLCRSRITPATILPIYNF